MMDGFSVLIKSLSAGRMGMSTSEMGDLVAGLV